MSGLEVVGVVLDALPLLIEATKATKFYLEGIGRWWQFETDFDTFVRAITFEDIIFSQNMDLLLTLLDLSHGERNSLRNSPMSALWHHPDVVEQMQQHLNGALPLFTRILKELSDSLDELHSMIPAPVGESALPSSHTMQDEILKLCISFCRKGHTVLDRLSSTNQQLERILRNANDSHSVPQPSKTRKSWKARLRELKPMTRASNGPSSTSIKDYQGAQAQAAEEQTPRLAPDSLQGTSIERSLKTVASSGANICSLAETPASDGGLLGLGLIQADYHDVKFFLEPRPQQRLLYAHNETIETLWSSRRDLAARLQIGLSIAAMLLGLGTSA